MSLLKTSLENIQQRTSFTHPSKVACKQTKHHRQFNRTW